MLFHVVLVSHNLRYVETPLLIGAGNLDHLESEIGSQKNQWQYSPKSSNQESCELEHGVLWVDDNL